MRNPFWRMIMSCGKQDEVVGSIFVSWCQVPGDGKKKKSWLRLSRNIPRQLGNWMWKLKWVEVKFGWKRKVKWLKYSAFVAPGWVNSYWTATAVVSRNHKAKAEIWVTGTEVIGELKRLAKHLYPDYSTFPVCKHGISTLPSTSF